MIRKVEHELLGMEIPVGNSITRISKTPRFEFPSYIKNIEVDFISMFSIS
ncbi:hypothetical protein RO3G_01273 [Rhizopus delemar RA 99-880]|uniref:Uncharacterized protein n=1 Tax=Rhizopus delemar (strain RA 99-880 / ATCC MYA-4621 / FGSC 9543 / NRRL 43880) TaxID=246409 RepID=I1BK39_RHIO9|nr:hypothetical protein RO3G_01273 [Rhizopus delemar RA 99-880]|eukprot:EIE76569.1 hypothetical protein RO3G_01273 [Rhizopus delemar RA 99-880]